MTATEGHAEISDEVKALLCELAPAFDEGTLIVLPARLSLEGIGQYRDNHLVVAKELRHFGVRADFLQRPEERTGLSEFSAEIIIAFAFGVSQNMTWDAAKTAVQYLYAKVGQRAQDRSAAQISVSVARVARADGTILEDVHIQGPIDDDTAAKIVRALAGDPILEMPESGSQ